MGQPTHPPPPPPRVTYLLIPELGDIREFSVGTTDYKKLRPLLAELLKEDPEHVAVLYEGNRRDMFVGETSAINGRFIRNIRATDIYRNNTLTRAPGTDPESLPAISGPAIIFPHTIIWK